MTENIRPEGAASGAPAPDPDPTDNHGRNPAFARSAVLFDDAGEGEPAGGAEKSDFDDIREKILAAALMRAAFDGWTDQMARGAAGDAGLDRAALAAAFPGGVRDILRYWSAASDAQMRRAMTGDQFDNLKIREKVAFAVSERLKVLRRSKEAARRAAATLALPHNAALGAHLTWMTADEIWRGLGDKSTDFNFYTKRATLTAVWTSTFARWLSDDSEDEAETQEFLRARIENVMQFEKVKARIRDIGIDPAAPWKFLAGLRYPGRG